MTKTEAMKELKANGNARTRKTYRRHGVEGDLYGVSYAALGKMRKKIKTDQPLAEQLWATGNHDARVLATMIAAPAECRASTFNTWAKGIDNRHLAAAVSNVAALSPVAKKQADKWTASRREMLGCTGWHTLASLAREENDLPDAYFEERLQTIESKIDESPNWVKYAMNNALINIGVRNSKLEKKAIATAKRIGKIEVDHGDTSCKTPDAVPYIKKTVAHNKKKKVRKSR